MCSCRAYSTNTYYSTAPPLTCETHPAQKPSIILLGNLTARTPLDYGVLKRTLFCQATDVVTLLVCGLVRFAGCPHPIFHQIGWLLLTHVCSSSLHFGSGL